MHSNKKALSAELTDEATAAVSEYPISFAIFALARSHRGLGSQLIREAGLFPGQEIILMQLFQQDGQSQNSLSRTLRLDHSTIAKSIRRLADAGLITRSRSAEDGRVALVHLTEAGWKLQPYVSGAWDKLEQITTENLNGEEKAMLQALSQKIAFSIDAHINKHGER
ncbi:DNA-binding MarR family transcriptional regulator [Paenibacillus endophyticus]|uniref:DNA-binding MarR family transcriptional regulator n=1 Tax=Paenibacillus endophyticus TaxID=1294268 RepID=A0A7W5CCU3_9BACL|nr:MarR family winged helix-turn-helix transcriptional regulator [Paenibacillus endophyticus]MBB3155330.1 DNA-binding MarR family transcriptional regulator [Paenibacillus endophyticus]